MRKGASKPVTTNDEEAREGVTVEDELLTSEEEGEEVGQFEQASRPSTWKKNIVR